MDITITVNSFVADTFVVERIEAAGSSAASIVAEHTKARRIGITYSSSTTGDTLSFSYTQSTIAIAWATTDSKVTNRTESDRSNHSIGESRGFTMPQELELHPWLKWAFQFRTCRWSMQPSRTQGVSQLLRMSRTES